MWEFNVMILIRIKQTQMHGFYGRNLWIAQSNVPKRSIVSAKRQQISAILIDDYLLRRKKSNKIISLEMSQINKS